ncbi:serine hydrolase domain-containing protein [Rhodococcus sp. BH5]|uniref:serine hydrolase domain-containing protein n=1 Tax=Rhodococcus sp. BH5 TaxID=2871702 RepID=UPI0022CD316E|nr:serine hydrolase [Rhodococcus sp. BH5]MCZ9635272.1 beta-lactamase family protein [Rhodococcus sp. BH5]
MIDKNARRIIVQNSTKAITLLIVLTFSLSTSKVSADQLPAPVNAESFDKCTNPTPEHGFESKKPELLGIDGASLDDAIRSGVAKGATSLHVYRNGCLAGSTDNQILNETPFPLASGTKSVVALAVGRAMGLGFLTINDPLSRYFNDLDEDRRQITIRQLLTQSSGLEFSWGADLFGYLVEPARQALNLPLVEKPGATFAYGQSTIEILIRIMEISTGQDFLTFVQNELFEPLGIPRDHWVWVKNRMHSPIGAFGLAMRPSDLGRLGQMMLQMGHFSGKEILSETYIEELSSSSKSNPGYGFLTWVNSGKDFHTVNMPNSSNLDREVWPGLPKDMYVIVGLFGQIVAVVPSLNMVITRVGGTTYFDAENPNASAGAEINPDIRELLWDAVSSAIETDSPDEISPIKDMPNPFSSNDLRGFMAPDLIMQTVTGVGPSANAHCNLASCNGDTILSSSQIWLEDALKQIDAARASTEADLDYR